MNMQNLHHLFVETFDKGYWYGIEDCIIVLGCFGLGYIAYRIIKHVSEKFS